MPRACLTPLFVRSVKPKAGSSKTDYWDSEVPGLVLEVRASGGKTYYAAYREDRGRKRQVKIGSASVLKLGQARVEARRFLADTRTGEDPQGDREVIRAVPTVAEFFGGQYLRHAIASKKSWKTDEVLIRLWLVPWLGRYALDELAPEPIQEMLLAHHKKGYAGGTLNRVRALLVHGYNLARKWKVPGITADHNPARDIPLRQAKKCQRFLTEKETERLVASINADENWLAAQAVKTLMLTGARRAEVAQAKWGYIDWKGNTLLVPVAKSGKPRHVSLSDAAVDVLRGVYDRAEARGPDDYVFDACVRSNNFHWQWDRMRKRAGLGDVRMHDLRHSFASRLVKKGVSLYVVQNLLGHSTPAMTQRYAHLDKETLKGAADLVSAIPGMVQDVVPAEPLERETPDQTTGI